MAKTYRVKNRPTKVSKLPQLREQYDPRTKYPWIEARTAYIEGYKDDDGTIVWPGPTEIANKFDIPVGSVTTMISRERWKDHREAHQNQIAIARQKEHAKLLAKKAVKFDEVAAEAAITAQELILGRLLELKELRALDRERIEDLKVRMEMGEIIPVHEFKSIIYHSELESLAKSLAAFNDVGRKALGIKDDETTNVVQNIEINQTSISHEMARPDQQRVDGILSLLSNKNLRIGDFTAARDAQNKEIIEGEFTEITDGSEDGEVSEDTNPG